MNDFKKLSDLEMKATPGEWITFPYYHLSICTSEFPKQGILNMVDAPHQSEEMQLANAEFICEAKAQVRPLLTQLSEALTRQETASKNAEFYANETVKLETQLSESREEIETLRAELLIFDEFCRHNVSFYPSTGLAGRTREILENNKEII